MVKFILDLLTLANNLVPLFFSLAVLTALCLLLSRSIKRHAGLYYLIMAIPFVLTALPFILGKLGIDAPKLNGVPVLSYFVRDYIHMGTLGFPLLVIIMYMGALDTRHKWVGRLMSIRSELSIIVGFPVLTHTLIRCFASLPGGWRFFFDQDAYLAERPVRSMLGAGLSSFAFVLGVVMAVLFLVLWVTSFPAVRRRMGQVRWKGVQRWAYVLYAMLFVHAVCIQTGGLLNPRGSKGGDKDARPMAQQAGTGGAPAEGRTLAMNASADRTPQADKAEAPAPVENAAPASAPARPKGERPAGRGGQRPDAAEASEGEHRDSQRPEAAERSGKGKPEAAQRAEATGRPDKGKRNMAQPTEAAGRSERAEAGNREAAQRPEGAARGERGDKGVAADKGGERKQGFSLADVEVDRTVKSYIHLISVILVFGSYLVLRIRKARRDAARRSARA